MKNSLKVSFSGIRGLFSIRVPGGNSLGIPILMDFLQKFLSGLLKQIPKQIMSEKLPEIQSFDEFLNESLDAFFNVILEGISKEIHRSFSTEILQ